MCHDQGVARFLFVVVPLVARVWPAVAIGDALAEAGHDVAWCGPEGDLRQVVGAKARIFPTGKRAFRQSERLGADGVRELWDEYVLPLNRFLTDPVERAVDGYQPDVVVADQYALAGALAAHRRGIAWATLCSGMLELTPPADPGLHDWVLARLALARQRAGLPAADGIDLRFSPYLVIATTVQALAGLAVVPAHYALIGAAFGPRRTDPDFSWEWWDPVRRHVLVTTGTVSAHLAQRFMPRMMAALEPLADRVQCVVNVAEDAFPDLPPYVLVAPRLPMLKLMPSLDAVVCQAGQSTVNEALAHGVPLVVAPIRLGEPATAEQVARAGAGAKVSFAEATPAQLTAALTAVLDEPGYRAQARRLSEEFAAAGGTAQAVARLTSLAG